MKTVAFIGAGSFGTALSTVVAAKGCKINIYDIDEPHLKRMEDAMENIDYLPGVKLSGDYHFFTDAEDTVKNADIVVFSVPAQHFRSAIKSAAPFIKEDALAVNIAKGIEQHTLKRMSEVAEEYFDMQRYACISGPSHAEEVGLEIPTALAVTSANPDTTHTIGELFSTNRLRLYSNEDMIGMELAGSVKNVMAVGSGIIDGLGYGDNTRAALITRGLAEMTRLGVKLGAKSETFAGLAGVGDMIVTCTSMHSRNFRCGRLIGQGMSPEEATESIGMVVEGMFTAEAVYELSQKAGIEMECVRIFL
ncbi:MAG TPA: NAD(P)-dependent glycerol-3-phosphate dehydrogenase [Mogibacterium sp.]|nr:NAD(P)-dependent glycerol-3-phosphate dehydrogenase [Mogibacterium sp.]